MKIKLLFVYITIGLALLGCEINGLEEETSVQELELVPKESSNQQKAKTGANQASSPYSCLISTLAADEADYNYWNQSFWVHFPKPAIDKAEGKTTFKAFSFSSEKAGSKAGSWAGKDNVVRVAQCLIPDSDLAEILLENQLRKFGKGTWLESQAKTKNASNQNGSQINSAPYWECSEYFVTVVCQVNSQTGELTNCVITDVRCITYELVYDDPVGGGGGSGGPSDDPGECDPTGTEPCYNDGGGGSIPPPEPDPCDGNNPPAYCSNPCQTNDPIINNIGVQVTFERLWDESKTNLSIDQRLEQGGFIVQNPNNEFGFVNFPSDWQRLACEIVLPDSFLNSVPLNTIGIVHSHPFFEGEDTTSPNVCGEDGTTSYTSGTNIDDVDFVAQVATYVEDFSVKSYVIDGSNIVSITSWGYIQNYNRCGY